MTPEQFAAKARALMVQIIRHCRCAWPLTEEHAQGCPGEPTRAESAQLAKLKQDWDAQKET